MMDDKLREAGAADGSSGVFMSGENYLCHNHVWQLGVPGFFYPRSDWPREKLTFVGIVPPAPEPPGGWPNLPTWWGEVAGAERFPGLKVVVVAQGTVETDPEDLILPTTRAMAGRADVLVAAILGRRGARLPARVSGALPDNVRMTDYLHYDAILPHAQAWVHNAGYGAVTHGISHGVPMVVAGEGQDKTENARRIAYSEAGVDLRTARPKARALKAAVTAVLDDPKYKSSVESLRRQAEELDCFNTIETGLIDLLDIP
jgi:UDP:flavonoid glycosyltransferase YjiC (YdhE family)